MSDRPKPKHTREEAIPVAREMCQLLSPHCERIVVAGSLRRMKPIVGDVEILFVPKVEQQRDGLFDSKEVSVADCAIETLVRDGVLARRPKIDGTDTWGQHIKLATHVASGIPVDLFSTTAAKWYNMLVVRTGGKVNNTQIAMAAIKRGWRWQAFGSGFVHPTTGAKHDVESEQDVYEFVNMPYLEPKDRP